MMTKIHLLNPLIHAFLGQLFGLNNSLFCGFCLVFAPFFAPLSIGQNIQDSLQIIEFNNASLEMFSISTDSLSGKDSRHKTPFPIRITNYGVEMSSATLPYGWESCGFKGESLPDLLPGPFGTTLKPHNGNFYVGMVGRDNGTFESITQTLAAPLKVGVCYKLSVYLAKSTEYRSQSRLTGKSENYNRPLKLVILGVASDSCQFLEKNVIAVSPPIPNTSWRRFTFIVSPTTHDITRLIFAAQFVIDKPYNGNILLDNFSQIVPVNCQDMSASPLLASSVARNAVSGMNHALNSNPNQLRFVRKQAQLVGEVENTEGGVSIKNTAYEEILTELAKHPQYKLMIRVKKGGKLGKKRIAFLYSYIFKNTKLPAKRVEIKRFKSDDELNFWAFENDDLAIGYGLMEN